MTANATPLLDMPFTVTATFPEAAPLGTVTVIALSLQFVGEAATPSKLIVLDPREAPKFDPLTDTEVPTGPDVGDRLVMLGASANKLAGRTIDMATKAKTQRVAQLTVNLRLLIRIISRVAARCFDLSAASTCGS